MYRRGRGPTYAVYASNNNSFLRSYNTCSLPYSYYRHHDRTYDNNYDIVHIIRVQWSIPEVVDLPPYSTCSLPRYRNQNHTYDNNQYTVHIIRVQLCIAEVVDLP